MKLILFFIILFPVQMFFTTLLVSGSSKMEEYTAHKFQQNNVRILIVSSFLFFEQLFYAFRIAPPESLLRKIYILSAGLLTIFILTSLLFQKKPPEHPSILHRSYELSLGIVGMAIALLRILVLKQEVFRIPTIYVAVLYGVAVIFLYHYIQSLILYAAVTVAAIILIPRFHPHITSSSYAADIISNGCIAYLVSVLNYRSFVKNYENRNLIRIQNKKLQEKNQEIQRVNQELLELSQRDGLTDLYNRRKLDNDLKLLHAQSSRYGRIFTVIILDLDHFKEVNDTHGHEAGDEILKGVARILGGNIRETDIAGRWGGEEFLIICPETNINGGLLLAERLRKMIDETAFSYNLTTTASFGVASFSDYPDLHELLSAADKFLYKAKAQGRNRVVSGTC